MRRKKRDSVKTLKAGMSKLFPVLSPERIS
jgi:hypothetical protein